MNQDDALEVLAAGHNMVSVEGAQDVCEIFQVSFDEKLIVHWQNKQEALEKLGFFAEEEGPGTAIDCLDLSYHVAKQLGLGEPGAIFSGRGFQARANSQAIAQKIQGEEKEA